jgi:hypothetical protein
MPRIRTIVAGAISAGMICCMSMIALTNRQTNSDKLSVATTWVEPQSNPAVTGSTAKKDETGASYRKRVEVPQQRDLAQPAKLDVPTTWKDPPRR